MVLSKINDDDLADVIFESIAQDTSARGRPEVPGIKRGFFTGQPYINSWSSLIKDQRLITERIIKMMVKPGQKQVSVPSDAILSPLAFDWLEDNSINIVREK